MAHDDLDVAGAADEKCEREAVTVIVIYNPPLHSSQSIFEAAMF